MIIKHGLVFNDRYEFAESPLYIEDGKICDTASGPVIDASGCYVIPGLVDIHFHGVASQKS